MTPGGDGVTRRLIDLVSTPTRDAGNREWWIQLEVQL